MNHENERNAAVALDIFLIFHWIFIFIFFYFLRFRLWIWFPISNGKMDFLTVGDTFVGAFTGFVPVLIL